MNIIRIFTFNLKQSSAASYSTSVSRQDASKVYELRTYSLKPEHMKEYLTLTAEKFHLRTSHSVLHGYWTVELGGVNQVVHLLEYGKNVNLLLSYISVRLFTRTFNSSYKDDFVIC